MILHLVVLTTNVNIDKNQTMGNNRNPKSIYTEYIIILKRRSTNVVVHVAYNTVHYKKRTNAFLWTVTRSGIPF